MPPLGKREDRNLETLSGHLLSYYGTITLTLCLQIIDSSLQDFYIVLKIAKSGITGMAKNSSYLTTNVVMVNMGAGFY
jgi:hypothetical protein